MSKHLKNALYLIQHKFWVVVYGVMLQGLAAGCSFTT